MDELAKIQELEDRIKAPSIWGRLPNGIRFEDLQEKRYDDCIRLIRYHYVPNEICFKTIGIAEDREGTDEFLHNVRIWLKDKMSIAVVKEKTDKLVGCLVMRIQDKYAFSRTFSKVKIQYNPLYASIMKFYNTIEQPVNLFTELDVKKYMKIYILALKERYRHRGIAKELIKAAMLLAKSGFIPAITGIFQTGRTQQICYELGFKKFNEIYYVKYLINNEIVFFDTGKGNYGAALMGYRIPDVVETTEIKAQASSRFKIDMEDIASDDEPQKDDDKSDIDPSKELKMKDG